MKGFLYALAGLVLLGVVGLLERREARRRLDALWERIRRDIEDEERETIRPTMRTVTEMRSVWVSKGGEA